MESDGTNLNGYSASGTYCGGKYSGRWPNMILGQCLSISGRDRRSVMDVMQLPIVVDQLSKMCHFICCCTTVDPAESAELLVKEGVRLHGPLLIFGLDREPQVVSTFLCQICSRLGIDCRLSTVFHPQTDGQTERMNASMEQYLRMFVDNQQDNWVKLLPMARCAADTGPSESMKCTRIIAVQGADPRMSFLGESVKEQDHRRLDAD